MAKNVRIVPASGSIFFTADGFDVTGSVRLQTVGSTNTLPSSFGLASEVGIGTAAVGSTFRVGTYKVTLGMDIGTDFIVT